MRITVSAKPRSREQKVVKVGENSFEVSVVEPPYKGLANAAICAALAEYFKKPKSSVRLVSGYTSRFKTFEIT